jgi:hypothetical protein
MSTIFPLPPLDLNQRYSIPETCAYLRQSRAKTYSDIASGILKSITDGTRRYVPGAAIAERSRLPTEDRDHASAA